MLQNSPAKGSPLKTLQIKDGEGPRSTFTKLNKLNEREEEREREEVHRRLTKGTMTITADQSQKRIIAALIQPQTEEKAATGAETQSPSNSQSVQQPTEYKVRSIQTPVVDKLDPSISFRLQFRKAAEAMETDDP